MAWVRRRIRCCRRGVGRKLLIAHHLRSFHRRLVFTHNIRDQTPRARTALIGSGGPRDLTSNHTVSHTVPEIMHAASYPSSYPMRRGSAACLLVAPACLRPYARAPLHCPPRAFNYIIMIGFQLYNEYTSSTAT